MLGMKNHFDVSGSIKIRKDIAGVACTFNQNQPQKSICLTDIQKLRMKPTVRAFSVKTRGRMHSILFPCYG